MVSASGRPITNTNPVAAPLKPPALNSRADIAAAASARTRSGADPGSKKDVDSARQRQQSSSHLSRPISSASSAEPAGLPFAPRTGGTDVPVLQNECPVRQTLDLQKFVAGKQDRGTAVTRGGHLTPQARPSMHVKPRERLIEHNQRRFARQRVREAHHALHPLRAFVDQPSTTSRN